MKNLFLFITQPYSNHALHSHSGYSHPQWTHGQQEVTSYVGRDDNDFWYSFKSN